MNAHFFCLRPGFWRTGLLLLVVAATGLTAPPAELNLEAQLIWVTDQQPSHGSKYKTVEPAIAERFRSLPFRWKHFYEVNRKTFSVVGHETKGIQLSAPCRLEVRDIGASRLEVKLYGQKRLVNTLKQPLAAGELLIIGGDSKNTDAWLVVLRAADRKPGLIRTAAP